MNEKGYGPAELDKSSPNPDVIRGREQQNIKANGGAQSEGGTSGNAINGISETNPNKQKYMNAADEELSEGQKIILQQKELEEQQMENGPPPQ
jgi:hypothetical protein